MIRGRIVGAAATAALVLGGGTGLAACGSSDDGGGGGGGGGGDSTANLGVLERAASSTAKQQSFKIAADTEQSLAGKTVKLHTDGVQSGKDGSATIDFAPLVKQLGGGAAIDGALAKVGGAAALKADIVFSGTTFYLKAPALQNALKVYANRDVAPWAAIDLQRFSKETGFGLDALIAGGAGSQQALAYLRGISGNLTTIGKEKVDGAQTTHYKGTIDFAKAAKAPGLSAEARKAIGQTANLLKQAGAPTTAPIEAWVDEQGLIRREVFSQSLQGSSMKTTMRFYDYGKPVSVTIPPKDQQFDALALVDELAPGVLAQVGKTLQGASTGTGAKPTHPEIVTIK